MHANLIKAHCHSQEYWYIRQTPCQCGGEFEKTMQSLGVLGDVEVDRITARCRKCAAEREFVFDISSFGPRSRSPRMVLGMMIQRAFTDASKESAAQNQNPILKDAVASIVVPKMEILLSVMDELASARDLIGLDYIESALEHFKREAKKNAQEQAIPKGRFTGVWIGEARHQDDPNTYRWELRLLQEGDRLEGAAIIMWDSKTGHEIVVQAISGAVDGRDVSFGGTGYMFIRPAGRQGWILDQFAGSLNATGDEIAGVIVGWSEGRLQLRRARELYS